MSAILTSTEVFITLLKEREMRIPKFLIASTVCLSVVGGTAFVYAQSSDAKSDNSSVPSQTLPQSDQSQSPTGSGGLTAPSQKPMPSSTGTTPDNSTSTNNMDSSPSSTTPLSERPARADRN